MLVVQPFSPKAHSLSTDKSLGTNSNTPSPEAYVEPLFRGWAGRSFSPSTEPSSPQSTSVQVAGGEQVSPPSTNASSMN